MQLFITPYQQNGENILITEERVVHQLSKVLRAKKGDQIAVQQDKKRVVCLIENVEKKQIIAKALYEEIFEGGDEKICLAVAMPNKFEKMELIVQKCTEIGISDLIFFPAKHSLLKEISENKLERLEKISLEAVEQSRGRKNLSTSFEKNIFSLCENKKVFIAHQRGEDIKNITSGTKKIERSDAVILLVGPEGGRHADEESMFEKMHGEKISFGENILRTETAAIIGGRIIKNIFSQM